MQSLFKLREFLSPVLTNSHFQEKGVLTPEEFVNAGDLLVMKCPTWSWEGGDPTKARNYLPPNKQYLVTKNVPCLRRAKALDLGADEEIEVEGDWLETRSSLNKEGNEEVGEIISPSDMKQQSSSNANNSSNDNDEDIPDIEDFDEPNLIQDDEATLNTLDSNINNILKTRTYDLSITYDKYYQTPRVWLSGYDENLLPLSWEQVLEDVYADYANKTVTFEEHPHLSSSTGAAVRQASIHPCRHSHVMKKMIDRLADENKFLRVDLYLFLFLKFISAVIPTIQYDFTISQ